jgi:hypothetical protein
MNKTTKWILGGLGVAGAIGGYFLYKHLKNKTTPKVAPEVPTGGIPTPPSATITGADWLEKLYGKPRTDPYTLEVTLKPGTSPTTVAQRNGVQLTGSKTPMIYNFETQTVTVAAPMANFDSIWKSLREDKDVQSVDWTADTKERFVIK